MAKAWKESRWQIWQQYFREQSLHFFLFVGMATETWPAAKKISLFSSHFISHVTSIQQSTKYFPSFDILANRLTQKSHRKMPETISECWNEKTKHANAIHARCSSMKGGCEFYWTVWRIHCAREIRDLIRLKLCASLADPSPLLVFLQSLTLVLPFRLNNNVILRATKCYYSHKLYEIQLNQTICMCSVRNTIKF